MKDLPPDARPREKLLARGAAALSDAELLALLLRTGTAGKGVLQMAQELLDLPSVSASGFGGIAGLLNASSADLQRVKGLGPAKRAELLAVLELARRALAQRLHGVQPLGRGWSLGAQAGLGQRKPPPQQIGQRAPPGEGIEFGQHTAPVARQFGQA